MENFIGTSKHGLYGDNVQEMDFFVGKWLDLRKWNLCDLIVRDT